MKKNFLCSIFLVLFCGLFSCDKTDDCKPKNLTVKSLESEYGCDDTRESMNINLTENFIVIHSQQEFEEKVTGSCIPVIDFSTYDLVIGKKRSSMGNASINYILTDDCSKILKLKVTIFQNDATVALNLTYHALIPKLSAGETVAVECLIIPN